MHILFVHQNYPAQFGHIADYLARHEGHRCTFVSQQQPCHSGMIERIQYHVHGGATAKNHYCSRTFENTVWHAHGVYQALKSRPDIHPDLIVGHSGFGSTLFLRELYDDIPIINYFEYFYRPSDSDMDFRPDFPSTELNRLRARSRNAMLLLDLENCDVGYSPTRWQRDRFPELFRSKIHVIFDGIDTSIWKPMPGLPRRLGKFELPQGKKIVSYATRGMESMRGFDIFMKMAKQICERRDDVHFIVVGQDRVCYGGDHSVTGDKSFKEWVLAQNEYDLSRFHFLGPIPPNQLAELFNITDLHIYLTVPFVLSWSLLNALACGAIVLASDTAPVREIIRHGENGLLAGFFEIDSLVEQSEQVLDLTEDFRHLGANGARLIQSNYDMKVCIHKMIYLYNHVCFSR